MSPKPVIAADEDGEVQERHVRPFAEWLLDQRKGALANELSEALNDLVDAVNTHSRGGALTLKITVKPAGRHVDGTVVVADDVTVKLPEADRDEVLYFVDGDANLTRSNPAQPSLSLREVPRPNDRTEAKEASSK